jgi:hypothetical protein
MVELIGIHGPLNSGKDTAANYLLRKLPNFSRYAFAQPLKQALTVLFGFTQEQMEDRVLKEANDLFWEFSPRFAITRLGHEYGRVMLREDVWIKRAEMEHLKNLSEGKATLITDVRYQNEADWIRWQKNSRMIYLEDPALEKDERHNHSSEAGIRFVEGYHDLVINDKSQGFEALQNQLDILMKKYFN